MTGILFTGQGSQFPGMGASLLEEYPAGKQIFQAGSDILGFDLLGLCMEGEAATLGETRYAQPAIYATALLCLEAAKQRGLTFEAVGGHSLGEYAAMTAAGMLTVEDGFRALRCRAQAMDDAAKAQDSGMYAVLRLTPAQIEAVCTETDGYVVPVNYNSPGQTVIAGDRTAVDAAAKTCAALGGRTVALAVAAAFHSKLMQPAADAILAGLAEIPFHAPSCAFYANLTGDRLAANADLPAYCAAHCVNPVRFTEELLAMQRDGIHTFVELGPKRVLTGFVKQTLPEATAFAITDAKSLQEAAL